MKINLNMETRLKKYSEAFDYYLSHDNLPEDLQNDILGDYLKNVLDDPGNKHLCQTNDIWMEIIKTSILNFFTILLPQMDDLQKEKQKEMEYIDCFEKGSIQAKRKMWHYTETYITEHYSADEVNMNGYIHLMKNSDCSKDVIFESMTTDWRKACKERIDKEQQNLIKRNQKWFEDWVLQAGKNDFETILNQEYMQSFSLRKEKRTEDLSAIMDFLDKYCEENLVVFVYGKGKRKGAPRRRCDLYPTHSFAA